MKDNQGYLHQDVQARFAHADQGQFAQTKHSYQEVANKGHGRLEIRRYRAISDRLAFESIRHFEGWADLNAIVRVQRKQRSGTTGEQETGYYISSLPADAATLLPAIRDHWGGENSFHRVLNLTFGDDVSRIRGGGSP